MARLRIYPLELFMAVGNAVIARHRRSFERHRIHHERQHYVALVECKPAALRDGAPFHTMAQPKRLLRQPHCDRAMAKVLAAFPIHGLEAALMAVELVLETYS